MLKFARNQFLSLGISVERSVGDAELRNFLSQLHPVETSIPLVRIGGDGDGGYLVPDDLDNISACFSPGVDVVATFEKALVDRGIPCFLADASVDLPPISHPLIHFQKTYLGVGKDQIGLDAWVASSELSDGDLLLQMDIEGAEWPVLLNVSDETLQRFRIIVMEFHHLESIFQLNSFKLFQAVFARLLRYFYVVHSHPNNVVEPVRKRDIVVPRAMEMTFLRRDRSEVSGFATTFPHPLDQKNVPTLPDLPLPAAWHR